MICGVASLSRKLGQTKTHSLAQNLFLSVLVLLAFIHNTNQASPITEGVQKTKVLVLSGNSVRLPCSGLGQSPFVASLSWQCDDCSATSRRPGVLIAYRDGRTHTLSDLRMRLEEATFALHLRRTNPNDSGTYVCRVNGRQVPKAIVDLQVKSVPDKSGRPMVLSFSSRSANISWTKPRTLNFAPVLHYIVHIRRSEGGVWYRSDRTKVNDTHHSVVDLLPYTVYSFRVSAVNELGAGRSSDPSLPIQTLREVPSGKVGNLRAAVNGSREIVLSWQPVPADSLHGEFVGYYLTYTQMPRKSSSSERHSANAEALSDRRLVIADEKVTTLRVTGLNPLTQYVFTLAVRNPEGFGPKARVNETTHQTVPDRPAAFSASEIYSHWALLRWSPPQKTNSHLLHYVISVTSQKTSRQFTVRASQSEGQQQLRVDKLDPLTRYNLSIVAVSSLGNGPARRLSLLTDTRAPRTPLMRQIICRTPSSAERSLQVHWSAPRADSGSRITHYNVATRNARERRFHITQESVNSQQQYTVSLSGLAAGVYYVKLQAVARSIYQKKEYKSGFTEEWSVLVPKITSGCEGFRIVSPLQETISSSTLAGSVVITIVVTLLLLTTGGLLYKRRKREIDKASCTPGAGITPVSGITPAARYACQQYPHDHNGTEADRHQMVSV